MIRTPAFWQPQRRKLVSISNAAATGMHSRNLIATKTDRATISFWLKRTSSDSFDTFWASNVGGYQIYNNTGNTSLLARVPSNKAANAASYAIGDWHHFIVRVGFGFSGATDLEIWRDGVLIDTNVNGISSTELTTAGRHWLFGDDSVTTNTDGGYTAEAFDICQFDGIIPIDDLNFRNGRWQDLPESSKRELIWRMDGQGPDAGWDSSERGNHFVVENGGVTLSLDGLPPGANEWIMRSIPYVPAVVAGGIDFLADKGDYVLSGKSASISINRLVSMDAGAYTLAGQDLSILQTVAVPMDLGTFTHTGQSADITRQLQFSADLGTYTLAGQIVDITRQIPIVANLGTYTLDGQIVTVLKQIPIVADLGTYNLAGQSAELTRNLIISADLGTYTFSGKDLSILESSVIPMDTGTFALAGQSATITRQLSLSMDLGTYTLAGQSVDVTRQIPVITDLGTYALTGQSANITRQLNIVANLGTFTLTGQSANVSILAGPLSNDRVQAMHFQRHYEPIAVGA